MPVACWAISRSRFSETVWATRLDAGRWFGKALQQLAKITEASRREFVSSPFFALVYAGIGEYDQAFKYLDMAYDERASDLMYIKEDPRFDSLRSDPRYIETMRGVGLPP